MNILDIIVIFIITIVSFYAVYWKGEANYWKIKYNELRIRLDVIEDMRNMKWHRHQETYENRPRDHGCNSNAFKKGK